MPIKGKIIAIAAVYVPEKSVSWSGSSSRWPGGTGAGPGHVPDPASGSGGGGGGAGGDASPHYPPDGSTSAVGGGYPVGSGGGGSFRPEQTILYLVDDLGYVYKVTNDNVANPEVIVTPEPMNQEDLNKHAEALNTWLRERGLAVVASNDGFVFLKEAGSNRLQTVRVKVPLS
jgi:hypothetical protein